MPRPYRLGERAGLIQATRERILDAAIDLYTELGTSKATLRDIGIRADVAPNTLRHHFPTRDDLDVALVERLTADVELPDRSIFEGATTLGERLGRLLAAAGAFTDAARRLYLMWLREPLLSQPWTDKGAEYGARWESLMREALGPLADDEEALAVLGAVLQPPFFDAIRSERRSTRDVAALVTAVVAPWFEARAMERRAD